MLKTKTKKELDVDFIGDMAPLTKDEKKNKRIFKSTQIKGTPYFGKGVEKEESS